MDAFSFPFNQPLCFLFPLLLMAISFIYLIKCSPQHRGDKFRMPLPPGPKPWPIVGNLPEMLTNKPAFRWILKLMNDLQTEIACIRLGNVNVIPVTCPFISCEFLKKQDAIFASRPISMSTDLVSSGYLTTILVPFGEQWKKMRKIITHELVSPQKLQWLYEKRVEEADNLVQYVYNQCQHLDKSGLVDVRIAAQHYCGNVIRKMIFNKRYFGKGSKDGGPGYEEAEYVESIFALLKYIYAFCVSDFLPCLRGLDLDGHEIFLKKAMGTIKKYHDPITEDRIQQWKNGRKKDVEDWLDVLITLKDANGNLVLTPEEIKAQIIELMIATVDNPSNAVEWAIAEMINQPEMVQKAVEELDNVVGKGRQVQESDFPKLNYIKACAREAFRLHPIDPFIPPHVCMSDTVIANYFIPKGSHVLLSRSGLGRNPKVWDEPLKFKPERHLKHHGSDSDIVLAEQDLRFISFSAGRRGCPGTTLGSMMTIMLFARLLHGFTWNLPPNEFSIDLTESKDATTLANPLVALASPRLPIEYTTQKPT